MADDRQSFFVFYPSIVSLAPPHLTTGQKGQDGSGFCPRSKCEVGPAYGRPHRQRQNARRSEKNLPTPHGKRTNILWRNFSYPKGLTMVKLICRRSQGYPCGGTTARSEPKSEIIIIKKKKTARKNMNRINLFNLFNVKR